jgi:hypothetical protein
MNGWPVTVEACLKPARAKLDQYEFVSRDRVGIHNLPLHPYAVTVSLVRGRRSFGITIKCVFGAYAVDGQFHRRPGDRSIWLGSNFSTARGHDQNATIRWRAFVSRFGVNVGVDDKEIPVYLDFYEDLRVVIRLRSKGT